MSNENTTKSKKGLAVKIILPILLVCIVVAIWAIKNNNKDTAGVEHHITIGSNCKFKLLENA